MRLYHEIDRIWVTERAGIVPLAYGRTMLLRRPWVHSVWVNPLSARPPGQGRRQALRALQRLTVQVPDQAKTLERQGGRRPGWSGRCGAMSPASPPVATTWASSPQLARMRPTMPSTCPANPKTTPAWSACVGGLSDRLLGRDEVDLGEPRRSGEESVHRDLDPWRQDTADVLARGGDGIEVRGRAEVDDDARPSVALARRDSVHDPVGAHLAWIVVEDRNARLDARADDEKGRFDVALAELGIGANERGHGRRDADTATSSKPLSRSSRSRASRTASSSAVRSASVATRQCSVSDSPS